MDGISYMNFPRACVDGDGAYGIILRLVSQAGLPEDELDELVKKLDDCVSMSQADVALTDEDLINVAAETFDRKTMVFGMMMAAVYIRGLLVRHTDKFGEKQREDAMRKDPGLN